MTQTTSLNTHKDELKDAYQSGKNVWINCGVGQGVTNDILELGKVLLEEALGEDVAQSALFHIDLSAITPKIGDTLSAVSDWTKTHDSGRCIVLIDETNRSDVEIIKALVTLMDSGLTPGGRVIDTNRVWFVYKSSEMIFYPELNKP